MQHQVDFLAPLKPNIITYKLFGILLPEKTSRHYRLAVLWSLLLGLLEFVFFATQLVYLLLLNSKNVNEVTSICYILITISSNICKKLTNIKNIEVIKTIFAQVNGDLFKPLTDDQKKLADQARFMSFALYGMYSWFAVALTVFWGLVPFFSKTGIRKLPFKAWFPFDFLQTPWYETVYVYQIILVFYNCNLCATLDTLAVGFLTFMGVQCDCLCDTLENLHAFGQDNMDQMLSRCVQHHRQIKTIRAQVETMYDVSMVWQFAGSVFVLCSTLFQITQVQFASGEFWSMCMYQGAATFQIFVYCWFGNQVIFKSSRIPDAAFKVRWVECSDSFKKKLVFFIRNSQKPFYLLVGGIFKISIETFLRILRSSFSYYALLNNLNG